MSIMAEERDFRQLLITIESKLGIRCENYKESYLKRRIESRMRMNKITKYNEYNILIKKDNEELEKLRNALTINVTKFFRDPTVFEVIRREIVPDIIEKKKKIKIWCAGCATGEEPYTLAIIIYEYLALKKDVDVTILATDLDLEAIKKAKEGIYDKRNLENVSKMQLKKHFTELENGKFAINEHIKKMVKFSKHDLMSGSPAGRFMDVVSCRNVTIYFTENQKNTLSKEFHEALSNNGYYIIGKTEYIGREVEHLFEQYNSNEKIFRKATLLRV